MGRGVTIAAIQAAVAQASGLRVSDLRSSCKVRCIAHPRQLAMYLAHELTGKSYALIGYYFGGRDHSTVFWGCRQVEQRLRSDPFFRDFAQSIRASLTTAEAA